MTKTGLASRDPNAPKSAESSLKRSTPVPPMASFLSYLVLGGRKGLGWNKNWKSGGSKNPDSIAKEVRIQMSSGVPAFCDAHLPVLARNTVRMLSLSTAHSPQLLQVVLLSNH